MRMAPQIIKESRTERLRSQFCCQEHHIRSIRPCNNVRRDLHFLFKERDQVPGVSLITKWPVVSRLSVKEISLRDAEDLMTCSKIGLDGMPHPQVGQRAVDQDE